VFRKYIHNLCSLVCFLDLVGEIFLGILIRKLKIDSIAKFVVPLPFYDLVGFVADLCVVYFGNVKCGEIIRCAAF